MVTSIPIKSMAIDRLSVEERSTLLEQLWDSIAADSPVVPLTDAQRAELDRRVTDHDTHPDNVVAWADVEASIAVNASTLTPSPSRMRI